MGISAEDGKKVDGDDEADKTQPELKKDAETSNDNDDQKEAPAPKEEDPRRPGVLDRFWTVFRSCSCCSVPH